MTLDEGLRLDPLSGSMRQLHAEASRGMLGDLLEGTHLTESLLQDAASLISMHTNFCLTDCCRGLCSIAVLLPCDAHCQYEAA